MKQKNKNHIKYNLSNSNSVDIFSKNNMRNDSIYIKYLKFVQKNNILNL